MKKMLFSFLTVMLFSCGLNNPFMETYYVTHNNPDELVVKTIYRDFKTDGLCFEGMTIGSILAGIVDDQLVNGKPVFNTVSPLPYSVCYINGNEDMGKWYADDHPMKITDTMIFLRQPDGSFKFGTELFYPLDGRGYCSPPDPLTESPLLGLDGQYHNFLFTTEMKIKFRYNGNEYMEVRGDDDLWVFVNNKLVIDLGGTHSQMFSSSYLNAEVSETFGLNLVKGKVYQLALFHAERHSNESTFNFTLQNFNVVN